MSSLTCTTLSLVHIDVRRYGDSGASITAWLSQTGLLYALISSDRWNLKRYGRGRYQISSNFFEWCVSGASVYRDALVDAPS